MSVIKKIPIPLSGVMLGLAALGNLLQSYSEGLRYFCGFLAFIIFVAVILKIICYPSMIKEDMKNPVLASVAATFPMAVMLLSVYTKPFIGNGAQFIWYFGIILHILVIIYFTYEFILKFDIKKVFASYFVVYVGIAAVGVTAPAYGMQHLGVMAFWFAFAALIILLIIVGFRYYNYREIPEPIQPIFCIFAAPASLCLAAYIQSVLNKSIYMVTFLAILAFVLYLLGLVKAVSFLKLKFYPSFSAFTFPFVISGIAMKQTMGYLNSVGNGLSFLNIIILIQTIVAVLMVCYVLLQYIIFILDR